MFVTRTPPLPPRRRQRAVRGFMLLEVLVAILIFSIGVLGIVGLQAAMTKAQTGSKFRADASFLAQRVIANMWSDRSDLTNYTTANCSSHTRCDEWTAEVARALPNGVGTVAVTPLTAALGGIGPGGEVIAAEVTVTITWTPPNEQAHTFTTTSSVSSKSPT